MIYKQYCWILQIFSDAWSLIIATRDNGIASKASEPPGEWDDSSSLWDVWSLAPSMDSDRKKVADWQFVWLDNNTLKLFFSETDNANFISQFDSC
jgi:hypothetical protein